MKNSALQATLEIQNVISLINSPVGIAVKKALKGELAVDLLNDEERNLCIAVIKLTKMI